MNDRLVNALISLIVNGSLLVFVLGSMIWVFFDSRKIMTGLTLKQRKAVSALGPKTGSGWTAGCVVFWMIFFPWYLLVRGGYKRAQAKNRSENPGGFPVVLSEEQFHRNAGSQE